MSYNKDQECLHNPDKYEIEEFEVDDSHPDRHDGYTYRAYVCGDCGTEIDFHTADPDADRAEALADMAYEDWRDSQL